ncbi:hypothetical protein MOX02_25040 [Methylobacterium oxalidis]|uniref:Uncharacterized protein n=1 Tax=Methylobacterium oxalidis TaxID=944322 RepID=A0A512J3D3_9HYPH|nr:hypothetical protein MOX02_25040 [Methylobacterium oxalidis]GLS62838.1 hypothetical protein GCM10007888_12190 [Methylobacterium oxalidis]
MQAASDPELHRIVGRLNRDAPLVEADAGDARIHLNKARQGRRGSGVGGKAWSGKAHNRNSIASSGG